MKNKDVFLKLLNLKPKDTIHQIFDFETFNNNLEENAKDKLIPYCGTAGCLLGELPGIDENWSFNVIGQLQLNFKTGDILKKAAAYFELPLEIIHFLFVPDTVYSNPLNNTTYKGLSSRATLKEVQNNIKKFMENPDFKHFLTKE